MKWRRRKTYRERFEYLFAEEPSEAVEEHADDWQACPRWYEEDELPDPELFAGKKSDSDHWHEQLASRRPYESQCERPDPAWGKPRPQLPKRIVLLRKHFPKTAVFTNLGIAAAPIVAYGITLTTGLVPTCSKTPLEGAVFLVFFGISFIVSLCIHLLSDSGDETWLLGLNPTAEQLRRSLVSRNPIAISVAVLLFALIISFLGERNCTNTFAILWLASTSMLCIAGITLRYFLLKPYTERFKLGQENLLLRAGAKLSYIYDALGIILIILLITVFPLFVIYMLIFRS